MSSFLKTIGKGFLYLITLPLVLVVLAFFAVLGLFYFVYLLLKSFVLLFRKKTIFDDLEEDRKVREIKYGSPEKSDDAQGAVTGTVNVSQDSSASYPQIAPVPEPVRETPSQEPEYELPRTQSSFGGFEEEPEVETPEPARIPEATIPEEPREPEAKPVEIAPVKEERKEPAKAAQKEPVGTYIPKTAKYSKEDLLDDDDIFGL